ncbi:hypothetical protein HYV73_04350 [Candidatus Uhrbacteria bacterium]|nr:hypothetical protein [Candidatus Uhrbacteria bacterium]
MHSHSATQRRAWVVDVNMGYGHSRPAHALRDLCGGTVLSANDYPGIPDHDKTSWQRSRQLYEWFSRAQPIPYIGPLIFKALDRFQQIPAFYPNRDLSAPNLQVRQMYAMMRRGFGKHLIETLQKEPLPLLTTFFLPAFMAEYFDYPGDIYCLTTDADISRAWVPLDPARSRIRYFASNGRVVERLKLYGVQESRIFLTGFPMPKELIGGTSAEHLKSVLSRRLCQLDPHGYFHEIYFRTLKAELGIERCAVVKQDRPLTLLYMVGGAGAQRSVGVEILSSLKGLLKRKQLRLVLSAGSRHDIADYFASAVRDLGLQKLLPTWIDIPRPASRLAYFEEFPALLEQADILWTKPSEMSFYTGLGLPIILTDPIGSQEEFNRTWLQYVGGGTPQFPPRWAGEWLMDWRDSGALARMAWNGYVEAPTHGTYRIEDTILGRPWDLRHLPMII